jgi:plastocyanin
MSNFISSGESEMHTTRTLVMIFAVSMLVVAGCGGGGDEFELPPNAGAGGGGGGGPAFDPTTATGTITGNILFEGTPPEMGRINTAADPECGDADVRSELVLVTDDSKLQNVIVYVNSGHEGVSYATTATPIVLDQRNCQYTPHVSTAMAGQPIEIRNSDPTTHNIHAFPEANMVINFAQPRQGAVDIETFEIAEYMPPIPIRCDVHRWMNSFLGVFDHPFHTTSADTGTYSISVPAGTYEIMTWHEEYGEMSSEIVVEDGATVELDFTYSAGAAD